MIDERFFLVNSGMGVDRWDSVRSIPYFVFSYLVWNRTKYGLRRTPYPYWLQGLRLIARKCWRVGHFYLYPESKDCTGYGVRGTEYVVIYRSENREQRTIIRTSYSVRGHDMTADIAGMQRFSCHSLSVPIYGVRDTRYGVRSISYFIFRINGVQNIVRSINDRKQ